MSYTIFPDIGVVRRDADGAIIPNAPDNLDWLAYQAWIALGNTATPAPASADTALLTRAATALDASDRTVLRCVEAGIAVPEEWTTYRRALRAVMAGHSVTLPQQPQYPAGT